jgi:hypothetical protein
MEMPIWAVFKGVAFNTVFLADLEILVETEQEVRSKNSKVKSKKRSPKD